MVLGEKHGTNYLPYTKKHCKTNNQTVFSAFFHVLTIEFPSDTYISET